MYVLGSTRYYFFDSCHQLLCHICHTRRTLYSSVDGLVFVFFISYSFLCSCVFSSFLFFLQAEMTRLVKSDWMGLRRILPELLQATEQFHEAEPLLRQVGLPVSVGQGGPFLTASFLVCV